MMIRIVSAALLLAAVALPALACEYNQSVSTDTQSRAVAAQPTDDHATPPAKDTTKSAEHVPS